MEDHIHARQRGGGVVHLLPIEREVEAGAGLGLVMGLEEERTRSNSGVVDGLAGLFALPTPTTLAMTRDTSAGV